MIIRWWTLAAAGGTLAATTAAFLTGSWIAAIPALAALPAGLLAGLLPKSTSEVGNSGIHAVDNVEFLESRLHLIEEDLQRLTDEQDLLRGVFEVSTELVGCVDEGDARSRFAAAMRRWWSCRQIDLMLWERGEWRALGSESAGDPPELLQGVQLPNERLNDLILDLSAGVDGQAAIIVRDAIPQPTIAHLHPEIQMRIAEVLRSQLSLSLRRVLLYQHLQELARVDPLTTTHRRWYGERRLEELVEGGEVVAVAMVDIDHFKQVNDRFGHAAGDQVLTAVGTALRNGVRNGDLVCRYGGEEFLLIWPNTSPASASLVAERLRAAVAAIADLPTSVTVSIGTACVHQDEAALELVQRADHALYTAKQGGRNCVVSAEADMPSGTLRTTGRSRRSTARDRVL